MNMKIEEKTDAEIIGLYSSLRKSLLKDIVNDPQAFFSNPNFREVISQIDHGCKYCMGFYPNNLGLYDTDYMCKNCYFAYSIFDKMTTVDFEGEIVPYTKSLSLNSSTGDLITNVSESIISLSKELNSYVISMIVEEFLSNHGMFTSKVFTLYRCRDKVFTISEYYPKIVISQLETAVKQVILFLNITKEISFAGKIIPSNIVCIPKEIVILFGGKEYKYPFCISFDDFSKFSINIKNTKICKIQNPRTINNCIVDISYYDNDKKVTVLDKWTRLTLNDNETIKSFHKNGITNFVTLYYLILSIVVQDYCFPSFFKSKFLSNLWEIMWGSYGDVILRRITNGISLDNLMIRVPLRSDILVEAMRLMDES